MLSAPEPHIESIVNSPEEESGALLSIDLDESLDRYVRERADLVKRLKELSVEDWQRTAQHEAFSHYSEDQASGVQFAIHGTHQVLKLHIALLTP
jgi:hypothetical protein